VAYAGAVGAVELAGFPGPDDPYLAAIVWASFGVGRYASVQRQPWAAAGALFLLSSNLLLPGDQLTVSDVVFPVLFTAGPWVLGLVVRLNHTRAEAATAYAGTVEAARNADLLQATQEERLRIAQELHDVVAHGISALSLQAQVCRRRAESGQQVGVVALRQIETTAQDAMADLRRLLGVLRPTDAVELEPQDAIDGLPALVERCRQAGQDVQLTEIGKTPHLPPALSLAAFRIVQEALTNARRHGLPARCEVLLDWSDDSLDLAVSNRVADTTEPTGEGHGLVGMRERARLFEGSFHAGMERAGDGDRWVVRATLPTPAGDRSPV
jgi:signal transduction histidine kinase